MLESLPPHSSFDHQNTPLLITAVSKDEGFIQKWLERQHFSYIIGNGLQECF
jgi:hypothetical protein